MRIREKRKSQIDGVGNPLGSYKSLPHLVSDRQYLSVAAFVKTTRAIKLSIKTAPFSGLMTSKFRDRLVDTTFLIAPKPIQASAFWALL